MHFKTIIKMKSIVNVIDINGSGLNKIILDFFGILFEILWHISN